MKRSPAFVLWLVVLLLVTTLACSLLPGSTPNETETVPTTEQVPTEAPTVETEAPPAETVQPETPPAETAEPEEPPAETVEPESLTPEPTAPPTTSAGAVEQWAIVATASSEYGSIDWSAMQAIGAPNTTECGDFMTAWASTASDSPYEWLELSYGLPVYPEQIRVYETYNPGSIIRVEVITLTSDYIVVWEDGPRVNELCPHILVIPVEGIDERVSGVRITLDQSVISDWNEIDAVQLVGRIME